jgi:hypothetical protein
MVSLVLDSDIFVNSSPCKIYEDKLGDTVPKSLSRNYETVIFNCSESNERHPLDFSRDRKMNTLDWDGPRMDLMLTANFTGLLLQQWRGQKLPRFMPDSLRVYICLTSDFKSALMSTPPTLLRAGVHLAGEARITARQRLKAAPLSTFGLFDVSISLLVQLAIHYFNHNHRFLNEKTLETFPIAEVPVLDSDPFADDMGRNISTLRVTYPYPSAPLEWTIIQDTRTKSIISGFAQVGGLGSMMSFFFIVLFGKSLLGIMYRESFCATYIRMPGCLLTKAPSRRMIFSRLQITYTIRDYSQFGLHESKNI